MKLRSCLSSVNYFWVCMLIALSIPFIVMTFVLWTGDISLISKTDPVAELRQQVDELTAYTEILDEELRALLDLVQTNSTTIDMVTDLLVPLSEKIKYHDEMMGSFRRHIDGELLNLEVR